MATHGERSMTHEDASHSVIDRGPAVRAPFAWLFLTLVVFLVALSIHPGSVGTLALNVGLSGIFLAGLGLTRGARAAWTVAGVFVLPNVLVWWVGEELLLNETATQVARAGLTVAYFLYMVVQLVRALASQATVTRDTVLGGISVYLLLAFVFMQVHLLTHALAPGSYSGPGVPPPVTAAAEVPAAASAMLYFSFTTLTTLGYGDIVPTSPFARMLTSTEAVVGQLYVAIFIGRLVALYVGGMGRRD